jgi:hypothetical protein
MRRLVRLLGLLLAASAISCADDVTVRVKVAPGFSPAHAGVSVLGVFRDGRMSVDAWGPLSLAVSSALGGKEVCEPAFSARLQRENEPLFASIDEQAKSDGITEDLLGRLAPSAQGELILAITMHGGIGPTTDKGDKATPAARSGGMPPMRGMGARGMGGAGAQREPTPRGPAPKVLELAATLFSVRGHKPVARLTFTYAGESADDAVRQFAVELGKFFAGASCAGWRLTASALPPAAAPLLDGP